MPAQLQESPFNNIADEIRHFPLSAPWSHLPWFEWAFAGNLKGNDIAFATDAYVANVTAPILILHARVGACWQHSGFLLNLILTFSQDDPTVPFALGVKLYDSILSNRRQQKGANPVQFVEFRENLG